MKRSLRSWIWRVPVRQEVDEEIAFHIEMRTRELIERGMDPAAAREQVISRIGNVGALKQSCERLGRKRDRHMRISQWMEELAQDARFALRQLRRSPTFALVAIVTLALGIGVNGAIFALVDATLLRPLPFRDPDRLLMAWERTEKSPRTGVAARNLNDWNERTRTFVQLSGFVPSVGGVVMAGKDGSAENVPRQWVQAGIFDVLGIAPIVGRTFLPDDTRARASVVVMNETFWRTRFNADPTIVGKTIRLDGTPYTVVGVVPREAGLLGETSLWGLDVRPPPRTLYNLLVIGRMKPGVTVEQARADLIAVAAAMASDLPETNTGRSAAIEPLHDAFVGSELRLTSMLFLGVVGLVLLICCANVANLLLARATVRTRELAVRAALGAGRRRVIRQLLTESIVLAALGGACGIAMGAAILKAAPAIVPVDILPRAVTLTFNARVIIFCAGAALAVGLLFGLVPAWQATQVPLAQAMASGSRGSTGRGGRVRSAIVAAEVAVAVLLLFGGGLLLRTLLAVDAVDRGYRADQALTLMVDPPGASYPSPESLTQFFTDVEQEVRNVPGVRSVGWATTLPMGPSDAGRASFEVAGDAPLEETRRPTADFQIVSPSYFETLDLPIVAGRQFNDLDRREGVPVCIVNEAFVSGFLKGRSPIGLQIATRPAGAAQARPVLREIVGVARQIKGRPDEQESLVQIYVPLAQSLRDDVYMIVRPASGDAADLAPSVRAAIGRIDKAQLVAVHSARTLDDLVRDATSRHRFRALLVASFAGVALLLAMAGVFGLLAYSVQQRSRDIGVRRALGATTADIMRLVGGNAVRVVGAGVAIGLALSAALGRLLSTVLFGVEPLDALTFVLVAIVLTVTAAVAVAAPAWRAARIDPVVALRGE